MARAIFRFRRIVLEMVWDVCAVMQQAGFSATRFFPPFLWAVGRFGEEGQLRENLMFRERSEDEGSSF